MGAFIQRMLFKAHGLKGSVSITMFGYVNVVGVGVGVGKRLCQDQVDCIDVSWSRGVEIVGNPIVNFEEFDVVKMGLVGKNDRFSGLVQGREHVFLEGVQC